MKAAQKSRKPAIAARRSAKRKPNAKSSEHLLNEQCAEPQIDGITAVGKLVEIQKRVDALYGVFALVAAADVVASPRACDAIADLARRSCSDADHILNEIGDLIVGMLTAREGSAE